MIVDSFENCKKYYSINKRFEKAFEYILKTDIKNLSCGKYEIEGQDLYINIDKYETKTVSKPEYHKKYIDIQFLIDGEEYIGFCPKSDLIIDDGYDEQKDLGFGEGIVDLIKLKKGLFMMFFPDDAHQPCMAISTPTKVKKAVVKVRVDEKKLKRVYTETVCAHLISPAFKKSDVEKFDNKSLTKYFTEIWNYSIKTNFCTIENDFTLNKNYIEQEKKCYFLSKEILELMPENADFKTLLNNIGQNRIPNNFNNYKTPQKIVLTEGITEEILLPEFSKRQGFDWAKNGVQIVGTGGKSRILNHYNMYKEQIRVPVFILLDLDAKPVFEQLQKSLRKIDGSHLISAGEIEDIIPVNLFKNAINSEFKLQSKISVKDFDKNISMVENLHNIYKNNGFGEFKKAKTAQLIKEILTQNSVLSTELTEILNKIKNL